MCVCEQFSSLLGILGAMVGIPLIACNFSPEYGAYYGAFVNMVFQKVCPGIGCALIFGNFWYAWMAAKLAQKEERMDVTALPYGINTPAGFMTVFMVMLPICFKYSPAFGNENTPEEFADKAFEAACCANLLGGLIEVSGCVIGEFIRRNVPRAALFAPICGVGFVWLGFSPLIDVMREPLIGFIPLALCFTGFFAANGAGAYHRSIPVALVIFVVGTALWWAGLARWDTEARELNEREKMADVVAAAARAYPGKLNWTPFINMRGFSDLAVRMFAIQIPIALCSFIETIENVEAAELAGDAYNVCEAMLADGLGTCVGALTGSVVPTTVYIGHRRHKAAGATALYSLLNGLIYFILMFSGLTGLLFYIIDPVSIGVILIAVGLMIVQHALEASASRHYPALLIGIMFPVADMVYFDHFDATASMATRSLGRMRGVANMAPGAGVICSLILPAILCDLTDQRYARASIFCLIGCLFSLFGLMHGNNYVFPNGEIMHANTHSYDLGEVMLSTYTFPSISAFGAPIDTASFRYRVNNGERVANEGWRFAVAYAALFLFSMGHAAFQKCKPDVMVAVMDNGKAIVAPTNRKGSETAEA